MHLPTPTLREAYNMPTHLRREAMANGVRNLYELADEAWSVKTFRGLLLTPVVYTLIVLPASRYWKTRRL